MKRAMKRADQWAGAAAMVGQGLGIAPKPRKPYVRKTKAEKEAEILKDRHQGAYCKAGTP